MQNVTVPFSLLVRCVGATLVVALRPYPAKARREVKSEESFGNPLDP